MGLSDELTEALVTVWVAFIDALSDLIRAVTEAWQSVMRELSTRFMTTLAIDPRFTIYEEIMAIFPDWMGGFLWWLLWTLPDGWWMT